MNKEKARDPLTQKILDLTLEIIFLLTGEGHMVVKIHEMVTDNSRHQISEGGYCRTQSFNTELPPHSGIHQQNNEKILELTNKIICLLTGEIPIRCEDVSVYLSMEEWEYVERHKDLYKYVMMEDHQPIVLGKSVSVESHTPVSFSDFGTEYIPSGGKKYLNKARKWRVDSVTSTEAEPLTFKERYFPEKDIYPNTEYTEYFPVVIKEEPVSSEEENLTDTDLYKPTEHTPDKSEEYLKGNINPSESLIESIKPNQSLYYTGLIYDPVYAGNSVPPSEMGNISTFETDLLKNETNCGEEPISSTASGESSTTESASKYQNVYTEEQFSCPECEKHFTNNFALKKHQRIHKRKIPFKCPECGKCFDRSSDLARHEMVHTGEKTLKFSECEKGFTAPSHLATHKWIYTGEKTFKCLECGKWFSRSSSLARHKMIHKGDEPFKCTECGECFTVASSNARHKTIHIGEKTFKCLKCGKDFIQASNLAVHKLIHTREKTFNCTECGKWFSRSSNLAAHKMIHTGVKPFNCSECEKGFTAASHLAIHKRIHTGERPFKCLKCGKGFSQASNLEAHKMIHTREKPFNCTECGKWFSRSSNLTAHKMIHTGVKPFKCTECEKGFTVASQLAKHKKIHTGEKPCKCTECGNCFALATTLTKHKRTHT
uniref:C2H2-type domain-containing protein n=1 Tax=Leptobrachium leishanense TaxID=445787 RepID=A0A8C5MWE1_9ANUR